LRIFDDVNYDFVLTKCQLEVTALKLFNLKEGNLYISQIELKILNKRLI